MKFYEFENINIMNKVDTLKNNKIDIERLTEERPMLVYNLLVAMEEYAQSEIKLLNLDSVTVSFCAIGRAEEYDICGTWENNGGDCKGCRHYIAHNER